MDNNGDSIKEILNEVHNSEEISKCRGSEKLIYENEFVINKTEAYEGLKNSGMIKTVGGRSVIYTIILVLAIAGFVAAYVIQNNINDLIFAIISFIVLVVIWCVPYISLKRLAKANANGNVIKFKVYSSSLHIFCNDNSWYIALDNSNRMKICSNLIIIKRLKDNQLFVIPLRAVEESNKDEIIDIIKKGTLSFEK